MTDNEEDELYHPRLLMLDDFGGEVEGRLKFHKSLYQYRNSDSVSDEWRFRREEHGPLDPGFSSLMQSYEDLELAESDEESEPHRFRITSKGKRFTRGLSKGLSKIRDGFDDRRDSIRDVAKRNKDRSGSEIEQDEDIQEAKDEPYQTDV